MKVMLKFTLESSGFSLSILSLHIVPPVAYAGATAIILCSDIGRLHDTANAGPVGFVSYLLRNTYADIRD